MNDNKGKNPLSKNGKGPKIPLNSYWIYMVALAIIMGIYFFSQGSSLEKEVSWSDFQKYTADNYVDKIIVYNKKNTLQAFIKPDSVEKIFDRNADRVGKNPSIVVSIPSADKFSDFYDNVTKDKNLSIDVKYEDSSNFTDILISLLPFILLIGIWIFIMRRMSGGGGSGGGVFSVGKSKAQLYDKGAQGRVTFKDVCEID